MLKVKAKMKKAEERGARVRAKKKVWTKAQALINKVLVLLNEKISDEAKLNIKKSSSKRELNKVLFGLTDLHDFLKENGVVVWDPSNKKRKKKKDKFKGAEFDKTVNSIRPIYTPMGNKR